MDLAQRQLEELKERHLRLIHPETVSLSIPYSDYPSDSPTSNDPIKTEAELDDDHFSGSFDQLNHLRQFVVEQQLTTNQTEALLSLLLDKFQLSGFPRTFRSLMSSPGTQIDSVAVEGGGEGRGRHHQQKELNDLAMKMEKMQETIDNLFQQVRANNKDTKNLLVMTKDTQMVAKKAEENGSQVKAAVDRMERASVLRRINTQEHLPVRDLQHARELSEKMKNDVAFNEAMLIHLKAIFPMGKNDRLNSLRLLFHDSVLNEYRMKKIDSNKCHFISTLQRVWQESLSFPDEMFRADWSLVLRREYQRRDAKKRYAKKGQNLGEVPSKRQVTGHSGQGPLEWSPESPSNNILPHHPLRENNL